MTQFLIELTPYYTIFIVGINKKPDGNWAGCNWDRLDITQKILTQQLTLSRWKQD